MLYPNREIAQMRADIISSTSRLEWEPFEITLAMVSGGDYYESALGRWGIRETDQPAKPRPKTEPTSPHSYEDDDLPF